MNNLTRYGYGGQPVIIGDNDDPLAALGRSALAEISPETLQAIAQISFEARSLETLAPAVSSYADMNGKQVMLLLQQGADSAEAGFELEAVSGHCHQWWIFGDCNRHHMRVNGHTWARGHFPTRR